MDLDGSGYSNGLRSFKIICALKKQISNTVSLQGQGGQLMGKSRLVESRTRRAYIPVSCMLLRAVIR